MISLVLAVVLANPCMAIPTQHHHKRQAIPVQTCAVPVVPMCFRDPVPDPGEIVLPPLPYFDDVAADVSEQDATPLVESVEVLGSGYGGLIAGGGIETVAPVGGSGGGYSPPLKPPPAEAPELSAVGTTPALVLLLGGIAVLGAKRK